MPGTGAGASRNARANGRLRPRPTLLAQIEADGTTGGQHRRGCNCKKSHCQKKYCECFQVGCRCARCGCCQTALARAAWRDAVSEHHGRHIVPSRSCCRLVCPAASTASARGATTQQTATGADRHQLGRRVRGEDIDFGSRPRGARPHTHPLAPTTHRVLSLGAGKRARRTPAAKQQQPATASQPAAEAPAAPAVLSIPAAAAAMLPVPPGAMLMPPAMAAAMHIMSSIHASSVLAQAGGAATAPKAVYQALVQQQQAAAAAAAAATQQQPSGGAGAGSSKRRSGSRAPRPAPKQQQKPGPAVGVHPQAPLAGSSDAAASPETDAAALGASLAPVADLSERPTPGA